MVVVNVFISAVTSDNVSRKEVVAWTNFNLKSHLTKVEEMSTGAAYCQLTHLLFPDSINLRKVKFNPRSEPDILNNWKVLTVAWKNLGIDKPVDVEKLKKGKFQDNMEFLQWFYKFFNANLATDPAEYDAVKERFGEDLPALKGSTTRPAAAPVRPVATRPVAPKPVLTQPSPPVATVAPARNGTRPATGTGGPVTGTRRPNSPELQSLRKEIEELKLMLTEKEKLATDWETMASEMESERDHYYTVLKKVEELAFQAKENNSTTIDVSAVEKAIYEEEVGEEASAATENDAHDEALPASLDDTETF